MKFVSNLRPVSQTWFKSPWAIVVVALALRLVVMCSTYKIQLDPSQDHWVFGWETGRVARSIVVGEGFNSPYSESTGPAALIPPVYAYLVRTKNGRNAVSKNGFKSLY